MDVRRLRAGPAGGTIALVVGFSDYEQLHERADEATEGWMMGLPKLKTAALGAARFARWLRDRHRLPDAPLSAI